MQCDDPNCKDCNPGGSTASTGRDRVNQGHLYTNASAAEAAAAELNAIDAAERKAHPERKPKPGIPIGQMRNKACPCDSGKKFKKCCMRKLKAIDPTSRVQVPGWTEKDYYFARNPKAN